MHALVHIHISPGTSEQFVSKITNFCFLMHIFCLCMFSEATWIIVTIRHHPAKVICSKMLAISTVLWMRLLLQLPITGEYQDGNICEFVTDETSLRNSYTEFTTSWDQIQWNGFKKSTSSDQWMRSWCGPGCSVGKLHRTIQKCTIRKYQSDWVWSFIHLLHTYLSPLATVSVDIRKTGPSYVIRIGNTDDIWVDITRGYDFFSTVTGSIYGA